MESKEPIESIEHNDVKGVQPDRSFEQVWSESARDADNSQPELTRVRAELQQVTVSNSQSDLPKKTISRATTNKPSFIKKIFDRIGFPSMYDKRKVLRIGYAAMETAGLSIVASKMLIDAAVGGQISPEIGWFISDSLNNVISLSILPMISSLVVSQYVSAKESSHKSKYGSLLTVTKIAGATVHDLAIDIPEIAQERFLGEMHFIGKTSIKKPLSYILPDYFLKTELENLKTGIADLYSLAEACSNKSKELDGINVFIGVSPIVTKNLSRFGFRIFPYKDTRSFLEKIVDVPLDALSFLSDIPMKLRFKAHATQPSQVTVITRDELIKNMDKIKKLKDRLGV